MRPIPLIICYSRSGGTLLARCLQSMDEVFVVSEVHPLFNAHKTLSEQASQQLGIKISEQTYVDQVIELNRELQRSGKQLILRDWTFIDFTPHEINTFDPSYQFTQLQILSKKIPIIPIVFIRDAIDIWISRWCPPLFFESYAYYVRAIIDSKFQMYKYESFCENPKQEMKRITTKLNLPYNDQFMYRYQKQYVRGDMDNKFTSRGIAQNEIKVLKRKRIAKSKIKWLNQQKIVQEINQNLKYPTTYDSMELESSPSSIRLEIQHHLDIG